MALPINIEDLLNRRKIESERIEFKSGWNPDKIYRSIAAFANDLANIGGGYIIVGVEEENGIAKRPVKGVPINELDRIQRDMVGYNNKIEPFYMPRTSVEKVDGQYVLAIWVAAGNERPYNVMDNVTSRHSTPRWYVRNGSTTVEARGNALDELREMANRIPFDDRGNADIILDDISPVLVQDYLRKVGSSLSHTITAGNLSDILDQMNLYTGPKELRRLKNVAAMMFCENPEKYFPYTQIDVVIFPEGKVRNPNNFSEVTFKGPVPQLIYKTLEHLKSVVIKEFVEKKKDKAEALRYFNYPYQAIEEVVVNAMYHRDYQEYEPVEITIEPERLSVLSYAGPDRSISDESIREGKELRSRRYRNRHLGDFLKELDLSEGRSTGVPTIQDELKRNGSAYATFETDADRSYFLVDIPCHPRAVGKGFNLVSNLDSNLDSNLVSEQSKTILRLCSMPKSRKEILEAIGLSNHTFNFNKRIKPLLEDGLIAYTSQATKSPLQSYVITQKGSLLLADDK